MFVKHSSSAEVGTSRSSMNRTGKTNAAKDVHNHYNEYKEFHQCEVEAHICASFMQMLGMKKVDGMQLVNGKLLETFKINCTCYRTRIPTVTTLIN